MQAENVLALKGLQMFLKCLDQDDQCASRKYIHLTGILSIFCEQQIRSSAYADDIVARTVDIVAAKLSSGEDILNLYAYSFAVARHLLSDYRKRLIPEHIDDKLAQTLKCNRQLGEQDSVAKEIKEECHEKCLDSLPKEQRALITKYYERGLHCKLHREEMAIDLCINTEALNNRISRIRKKLTRCCHDCLTKLNEDIADSEAA
jgi:RNA polymerase sigma factor (sigma-70 family)